MAKVKKERKSLALKLTKLDKEERKGKNFTAESFEGKRARKLGMFDLPLGALRRSARTRDYALGKPRNSSDSVMLALFCCPLNFWMFGLKLVCLGQGMAAGLIPPLVLPSMVKCCLVLMVAWGVRF